MKIILASGSPRRRELLARFGMAFDVIPSSVEEWDPRPGEDPAAYALSLAAAKAADVAASHTNELVIGADTVVVLDDEILNKPLDPDEAKRMLSLLRGRIHSVVTAVVVRRGFVQHSGTVEARVTMRPYSEREIGEYVAGGEPMDKAGAYAVQGAGGRLVSGVEGCYDTVVGLPLCLVADLLGSFGVEGVPRQPCGAA